MKKLILIAILALAAAQLTACNTINGVGQDLSSASRGVSEQL